MKESSLPLKEVVVIGASAGGLQPLQQILTELPDELKSTAIIIAQHISPNYESMLANLLKKNTALEISQAQNDVQIEPNHIYTCPPDTDVRIINGKFSFTKPESIGPKPSVDRLFESAAKSFKENVLAIIISGTGHDGSAGVAAVKQNGGCTIVQDPETANYPGMPESALLTDYVDLIMSPSDIGKEIVHLLDKDYRNDLLEQQSHNDQQKYDLTDVEKILNLLHHKTGTDFSGYKTSTIHRRLEKRISDTQFSSVSEYIEQIKENPEELDKLFLYLLIGVTHFFRNPDSMMALRDVIKSSLAKFSGDDTYRVWVPGCATGEEAYTIGMLIHELIENGSPEPKQIQIFATDIDQTPLAQARSGKYAEAQLKYVPESYLSRYFTKVKDEYVVSSEIKKYILFSKHDLTSSPPFLRLNLVSCRNLLIYFKSPLQNQILPLFHYTLEPDGIMFLGTSETIGRHKTLFETIDLKNKIFRKKVNSGASNHVPLLQPLARPKVHKTNKNTLKKVITIPEMVKDTFY